MKKRTYSKELKEQAVRLSYQRSNIKELADELGIHVDRIYAWRKDLRGVIAPTNPNSSKSDDQSEIKRLRKELREKELELEIIKKAVHIFSKSDRKSINL